MASKYIAAGYLKDSEKLLKDFISENSTNFSVFATKWKEHNFAAIYLGRDMGELQQFTHEIFQLTLGFLQNNPYINQVGAIYLLYALFRNQLLNPPVRIRIILSQCKFFKRLMALAVRNGDLHLHYVINFLFGNSFDFVAHGTLYGPQCSKGKPEIDKTAQSASVPPDLKQEMSNFLSSNLLKDMKDLQYEYSRIRDRFIPKKIITEDESEYVNGSVYGKYLNWLEGLVNDSNYSRKNKASEGDTGIGSRRAQIKAEQFARKVLFRQLNPSDSDSDKYEDVPEEKPAGSSAQKPKTRRKKRRLPKELRKVGRPRKYDLEKLLLEADIGNTSSNDDKSPKKHIRKRGPVARTSYLEKYDLMLSSNKQYEVRKFMSRDLSSDESSEEEVEAPSHPLNF